MINIPKGTKDVLPSESYKWQYVEKKAREICSYFHFKEIRTPVFEHTELFLRSIGDETDVVSKEMYTFNDKGGRSITLKPEGTASVARSYIENALEMNSLPLKMFYITPVFRYERPQAGRLREHHQFGIEAYGSPSPVMDYEVIALAYRFLTELGISDLQLHINSIGCPQCRGDYNAALKAYFAPKLEKMCDTCKTRFEKNPLRILDCKSPECAELKKDAPKITDYICSGCKAHMARLTDLLEKAEIPYKIDTSIVRGLDYYTKTVFEFVTNALGAQGTVCGGGRYDNLVESAGGKSTPCVGFGLGLERLILLMETLKITFHDEPILQCFVMPQQDEHLDMCLELVRELRQNDIAAETDLLGRSLKSQFKYADKLKARYAVVIGDEEKASKIVTVKKLSDSSETKCDIKDLKTFIKGGL